MLGGMRLKSLESMLIRKDRVPGAISILLVVWCSLYDLFPLGSSILISHQIVSGDAPWKEKKHSFQICIELSKQTTPARPDNMYDYHWDLIQKCWSWEPGDRPDATRVLLIIERHWQGTSASYVSGRY